MKNSMLLSLLLSLTFSFSHAQDAGPLNPQPDKCYAKCVIIPDRDTSFIIDTITYAEYIGNDTTVIIEHKRVEVKRNRQVWVKKLGDKNCLSRNPNDCLVWCLVEAPVEFKRVPKIKNIEDIPESDIEYKTFETYRSRFSNKIPPFPSEYSEWREVLCASKLRNTYTIRTIQEALRKHGYDPGPSDNVLSSRTKAALTKFQKDKKLPVGQLDFTTLKALGVE